MHYQWHIFKVELLAAAMLGVYRSAVLSSFTAPLSQENANFWLLQHFIKAVFL